MANANEIKIRKHFVAKGSNKCRVWYSKGAIVDGRECITIYAKSILESMAGIFDAIENDTDIMVDYFEKDRVRIFPENPLYNECLKYAK